MFKGNAALLALKQSMIEQNGLQSAQAAEALVVQGVISAHPKGFGFLRVDATSSYFVAPPQMKRCLPGDVVRARIVEEKLGKSSAIIEEVVEQGLSEFIGTVRFAGENVFIEPESRSLKAWFFVPHSMRNGLVDGQVVKGGVTQHPFKTGRSQGQVAFSIGHETDKDIIWKLALARQGIVAQQASLETIAASQRGDEVAVRDLTHMAWVTIDGDSSLDLDDAVFAEKHPEEGWWLWVAIADVDSSLLPGSAVDVEAQRRAATAYLPGMVVPMLPHLLSEDALSLLKGVTRAAVCAKLHIARDGNLLSSEFFQAKISSSAKLTYQAVSDYVSGQSDLREDPEIKTSVGNLYWMSKALNNWRSSHALIAPESTDYRLIVVDYQLSNISSEERNEAMKVIEECMVVANRAYAQFMLENQAPFICRRQDGFTDESLSKITAIARHLGLNVAEECWAAPEQISAVLRAVNESERMDLLLATRSALTPSVYDSEAGHHASLGLPIYGTWTSPIRKYSDLVNHRQLKAVLQGKMPEAIAPEVLELVNLGSRGSDKAAREVASRLYAKHLSFRAAEAFEGTVVGIRPSGLSVEVKGLGARVSVHRRTFTEPTDSVSLNDMGTQLLINEAVLAELGKPVQLVFDPKDLEAGQLDAQLKV